jgi:hypothetical protein
MLRPCFIESYGKKNELKTNLFFLHIPHYNNQTRDIGKISEIIKLWLKDAKIEGLCDDIRKTCKYEKAIIEEDGRSIFEVCEQGTNDKDKLEVVKNLIYAKDIIAAQNLSTADFLAEPKMIASKQLKAIAILTITDLEAQTYEVVYDTYSEFFVHNEAQLKLYD